MNGVYSWLDEGEDDGKIVRELKLESRTSEELHKATLVRFWKSFQKFVFFRLSTARKLTKAT